MKISGVRRKERIPEKNAEVGDARALHLDDLRRRIRDGSFRVDSAQIADKLMTQMTEEANKLQSSLPRKTSRRTSNV